MADACVALLALDDSHFSSTLAVYPPLVNIGSGSDLTIRELAEMVCEVVGFRRRLEFDASKPDGTPRKLLDTGKLERLGWRATIGLREGIRAAYEEFKAGSSAPSRRSAI